jgi:hypothetical protein
MVRLLLLAAAALTIASLVNAAPAVPAPSFEAAVAGALRQVKAEAPRWTSVNMSVNNGSGFVSVSEPSLRINLSGSRSATGAWLSGFAGDAGLSFNANAFGNGWSLFGSGVNVTMTRFGDGYSVWGTVGRQNVSYTISRFGSGLSVYGQSGANVSVSGTQNYLSAFGQIDESRFSRQALAVMGAALALAAPAAK